MSVGSNPLPPIGDPEDFRADYLEIDPLSLVGDPGDYKADGILFGLANAAKHCQWANPSG